MLAIKNSRFERDESHQSDSGALDPPQARWGEVVDAARVLESEVAVCAVASSGQICNTQGVTWRSLALALLALLACSREPDGRKSSPALSRESETRSPELTIESPPEPSCEERMRRVLSEPAFAGTPELDAARVELFANVKAEPVIFVRRPEPEAQPSELARAHGDLLRTTKYPWGVLQRMLPALAGDPALARAVILREGYVYAETPRLALALYAHLSVEHLFREPRIWVERGERRRWAVLEKERYVWESGSDRGRPVRLLVFDRVGAGEPGESLHRDLRSLRERLFFERARPVHLGAESMILDLRYGETWVPTLLRADGARLELECEMLPERARAEIGVLRERGARQSRALVGLRRTMLAQVEEELVFDEPKDEIGQQDGHLRMAWQAAYLSGRRTYKFNDHEYRVFGKEGGVFPPQVCIDFLLDTLERASGTWWAPRGTTPGRVLGKLTFDEDGRRAMRGSRRFIDFAREKSEWFDVREPGPKERVEIGQLPRLTRALAARADEYRPGDMVVIHGYTPWDEEERHYHSFFIYESDPVTGFPLVIVGNAGRATMRVLRTEANRTPKRSIVARVRPRLEWLESVVTPPADGEALTPAPLVPEASGV